MGSSVFYVCVVYFVCLRSVYCIQCLQLPIPGCPVVFLCLCCVFCLSSFCVLYPMFLDTIHRTKTIKIHNTNIANWQENQEWAAVNIGYNTQNEDNQNTQHKHLYFVFLRSVYCIQCFQLPIPGCPVGFLCLCCVFCLSSFCVLYPMFTDAHSWLSRRFSMFVLHRKPTGQPGMGSCKHWIQYTERRKTKYITQT
jgi:hypothetical protein